MKFVKILIFSLVALFSFGQLTSAAQTFKDVSPKHSNYTEIEWAVSQGLLKGYSDQTFKPRNFLTEAQFAKIFTRYSSPETLDGVLGSEETAVVYKYLTSVGLTLPGHTSATVKNKNFTRIQVAKAFYQVYEGKAPASNNAVIDWMYAKGLTNGKGVSSNKYTDFGSNDPLMRAHISAFFSRYDKIANPEPLDEQQIVDMIVKKELGSTLELISFDRVNLTSAADDEYFIYLRNKSASLVEQATNTYIVASFTNGNFSVLKKWSTVSEYSFLERVKLNSYEQMIVWANTGSDHLLELTMVASNNGRNVLTSSISKVYKSGSFYVKGSSLIIGGDSYTLVNGKLQ